MRSVMKQEAFISCGSDERELEAGRKTKSSFGRYSLVDDKGTSFDLIGAGMSSGRQNSDVQTSVIRPDDHGKRSEFSLHIGC